MLLSGQGLDDVRAVTVHAAQLVSRYSTLSLYERQAPDGFELTQRSGEQLGPGAQAVEDLLCSRAVVLGGSVSTLEMFVLAQERLAIAEHIRYGRLCLVRPLVAYGERVGLMCLHYADRIALDEAEFDDVRRLSEYASVALSIAQTRTELRNFAYSDALTGLANRRWLEAEYIGIVQQRGAAVIAARGASSAFSAAQALVDHVRSLITPTPKGDCFSAAIVSDGSYGVPKGLVSSFPLHSRGDGGWQIVPNVQLDDFAKGKVAATVTELEKERDLVKDLLAG